MRKIYLSFIIYLLSLSPVEAQQRWTLDQCLEYAIVHNTGIRHLQNEQKRREVKMQASKDARWPKFQADMGGYVSTLHHAGNNNKIDANLSFANVALAGSVPLYTGNRLRGQIEVDKLSLLASIEDVRGAERNLKVQVATLYLQVLYEKGEMKIAHERLGVSRMLLQQARSLFEKGKRPESDTVEAAAIVSRDEALLTVAEGDILLSRLDLRQLLNLPDSVDFDICEPDDSTNTIPPLSPLAFYTQASSGHPALQSANYGIQQAQQGVKLARSGYFPTLSLVGEIGSLWATLGANASHGSRVPLLLPYGSLGGLSYHLGVEGDWKRKNFLNAIIGLKLSIPVFDAFRTKARIRTAKINLEDARLAYDDARQRTERDIRQAWQQAINALKRHEAEVKAEQSCALAYRYALKRYNAGMATILDLSQSRQQWFAAAENALRTKYEYLIRKNVLDIQAQTGSQGVSPCCEAGLTRGSDPL